MKKIQLAAALAGALALAACNGDVDPSGNDDNGAGGAATTAANPSTQNADSSFLREAMTSGMKEVDLGRLAEQKAARAEVKEFARMMVADHSQANDRLRQVVQQASATVSPDRETIDEGRARLADLTGADFDRAYIDMMVQDHQDAVNLVQDKTSAGHAATQQWATATLPTLRQHLDRARQIQQMLKK
jgi:putative membrane protein